MKTVNGTFGATGSSSTAEGSNAELIVGGTFVGTVQLQVAIADAAGADVWVPCQQLTAPGVVTCNMSQARKYRAACSAYTSGTIVYSLGTAILEDLI